MIFCWVDTIYNPTSNSKVGSLSARLVEPNRISRRGQSDDGEDDDDAIFAELEAEIENDDSHIVRERGLEVIKREWVVLSAYPALCLTWTE